MRKTLIIGLFIYIGIQFALRCGYKNPSESEYLDASGNIKIDTLMKTKYDTMNFKHDTTKNYKGNWVDVQQ